MRAQTLGSLAVLSAAWLATPATIAGQAPRAATYITADEVKTVGATPGIDHTIRVVDIGTENFAVGIIHRGATGGARGAARGAGAPAAPSSPQGEPCGEQMANPPVDGAPGITHDSQTEGYFIVSGSGTLVTGGRIANGIKSAPGGAVTTELNGPSCSGAIVGSDVVGRVVQAGDIIVIPAGVPHGWVDITDHVDYLSFRPSDHVLQAGYVHPSIRK